MPHINWKSVSYIINYYLTQWTDNRMPDKRGTDNRGSTVLVSRYCPSLITCIVFLRFNDENNFSIADPKQFFEKHDDCFRKLYFSLFAQRNSTVIETDLAGKNARIILPNHYVTDVTGLAVDYVENRSVIVIFLLISHLVRA